MSASDGDLCGTEGRMAEQPGPRGSLLSLSHAPLAGSQPCAALAPAQDHFKTKWTPNIWRNEESGRATCRAWAPAAPEASPPVQQSSPGMAATPRSFE